MQFVWLCNISSSIFFYTLTEIALLLLFFFLTHILQVVYPLFQQVKAIIPDTCLFSPERDKYLLQEENKVSEGISKWYCNYCGKGFYSEDFLDQHFDNRHPEFVREVVLAKNIAYVQLLKSLTCTFWDFYIFCIKEIKVHESNFKSYK